MGYGSHTTHLCEVRSGYPSKVSHYLFSKSNAINQYGVIKKTQQNKRYLVLCVQIILAV